MCNGLARLKLNQLFTLDDNNKGTRGHSWKAGDIDPVTVKIANWLLIRQPEL